MSEKKKNSNREILHQMKEIYFPSGTEYKDWMGYILKGDNRPSYHHIEKKEELRKKNLPTKATIENGAYLGKLSHEKLHYIEIIDKDLYECWNYIFRVINKMGIYPIEDVWKMIDNLQKETECLVSEEAKILRKKKKQTAKEKNS